MKETRVVALEYSRLTTLLLPLLYCSTYPITQLQNYRLYCTYAAPMISLAHPLFTFNFHSLTAHYSLLTAHYSLLTTHYSLQHQRSSSLYLPSRCTACKPQLPHSPAKVVPRYPPLVLKHPVSWASKHIDRNFTEVRFRTLKTHPACRALGPYLPYS